jgi:nicotinamidase-related amidase
MTRPALLIVDLQRGFVGDAMRPLAQAVESLQTRYERVFATQFVNRTYSPFRTFLGLSGFQPGAPETALAFVPRPTVRLLDKSVYSCVTQAFLTELFAYGIGEIDLAGPDLTGSVTQCAVGLFEAGVRPLVLAGYCGLQPGGVEGEAAARAHGLAVLRRLIGPAQVIETGLPKDGNPPADHDAATANGPGDGLDLRPRHRSRIRRLG